MLIKEVQVDLANLRYDVKTIAGKVNNSLVGTMCDIYSDLDLKEVTMTPLQSALFNKHCSELAVIVRDSLFQSIKEAHNVKGNESSKG